MAAAFTCLSAVHADPVHENGGRIALFQPKTIFHSGLRRAHVVALTFDDGPNSHTPAVLDALNALNVKATFFIVGKMAHRYPDVLARIAAEGHLLANHSATHPFLGRRFDDHPELLINQLRVVDRQIAPLMAATDKFYFRAPYGSWRRAHAAILNADPVLRNYVGPVYWDEGGDTTMTRDGYVMSAADWNCWHHHWTAETCAKGYLREIRRHDGGVVLMHCIHRQSAALVEAVVPALIEEGYRFVRVDQIPEYRQYETPPAAIAEANASSSNASTRYAEFIPPARMK
jgi:peptidoglycan/xylan/chitin deacetylase (PgdA/CDA1 family)